MSEHVVAIIQARVGSTRLPGKVLADVGGRPLIERVVRRVQRAKRVDVVAVAIPDEPDDARLRHAVAKSDSDLFVDHGHDVADVIGRYARFAEAMFADVVVRVCGDSPLVDPDVIDDCVELRARTGAAYCGNTRWRTYPRGLCVEAFTREALAEAYEVMLRQREHVTPWLKGAVHSPSLSIDLVLVGEDHSARQWSVDTAADLERVRALYAAVGNDDTVGWRDVLAAAERLEVTT